MEYLGKGLASLGICAAAGVGVWVTGSGNCLWALVALIIVW
jgi:hypothetical protein